MRQERIHFTRTQLDRVSRLALDLHLRAVGSLSREDWNNSERISVARVEMVVRRITWKQMNKFERLNMRTGTEEVVGKERMIINLSSEQLDEAMESVLPKGLNFVVAPKKLPIKETVHCLEVAIKDLSVSEA